MLEKDSKEQSMLIAVALGSFCLGGAIGFLTACILASRRIQEALAAQRTREVLEAALLEQAATQTSVT
jgi:type II secretory pathway component PulJ